MFSSFGYLFAEGIEISNLGSDIITFKHVRLPFSLSLEYIVRKSLS